MDGDVEKARVSPESHEGQSTLFPLSECSRPPVSSRDLCVRVGLNWLAAVKLYQDGWLSFDPESTPQLTPSQEAELGFLGRLVAAGCDEGLLKQMLTGLRKPYAYRLDRLHYDWETRSWELLAGRMEARQRFEHWIETLVDSGQVATLESLRASVDRCIREVGRASLW